MTQSLSYERDLDQTKSSRMPMHGCLPSEDTILPDIEEIHSTACQAQKSHYKDPRSGLVVFTAFHLRKRKCCGCGCRHCPHKPCTDQPRAPSLLNGVFDNLADELDVLFWSGGKDSYLALRAMQKKNVRPIMLLTTYHSATGVVAHQEVDVSSIKKQAVALRLPLLGVPVASGLYVEQIRAGLKKLRDNGIDVMRIAFGDLHLQHIRAWREKELAVLEAQLYYPLWGIPYDSLQHRLEEDGAVVRISAVDNDVKGLAEVKVGDLYNTSFISCLPHNVDAFGENGEFHTLVEL